MSPYAKVWSKFVLERRLEYGGHTDPSWRDGYTLSASLVVPVDVSRFRERLEPPRDALRPLPFVSVHPDHFMHLTLVMLGFVVDDPAGKDEISRDGLAVVEDKVRSLLSGTPAPTVRLANLNAFPGAAFIEVHDSGALGRLREALYEACGLDNPHGPPHLTLAYFHAPDGAPAPDGLISTISRFRDWPIGELLVDRVRLSLLDLRSDYPNPEIAAEMPLMS